MYSLPCMITKQPLSSIFFIKTTSHRQYNDVIHVHQMSNYYSDDSIHIPKFHLKIMSGLKVIAFQKKLRDTIW